VQQFLVLVFVVGRRVVGGVRVEYELVRRNGRRFRAEAVR